MIKYKYANWQADKDTLKDLFERSIKIHGKVKIETVLDHCSESGMTRWISAYVNLLDDQGAPYMTCIAREKKMGGCGMDMGFALAHDLFMEVYGSDPERRYQDLLRHSWL